VSEGPGRLGGAHQDVRRATLPQVPRYARDDVGAPLTKNPTLVLAGDIEVFSWKKVFVFMPVIISLGFFAMIVWIVWLGTNAKNRRAQAQAEVQSKLIERFSTSKEFIEFCSRRPGSGSSPASK